MPSPVVAQISEIKNLQNHPDADRLELSVCGGWDIVCGKGIYTEGERVVFITPDSLISDSLAEDLGIKHHLSTVKNIDGTFVTNENGEQMFRVRQAKLRGFPSFGTTVSHDVALKHGIDLTALPLGENVAQALGIAKYEPAMRSTSGDAMEDSPYFPKYTSIENLRNYPAVFEEYEPVYLVQKVHGTNCRVGLIEGEYMAGSHSLRRQEPEDYGKSTYWMPLALSSVQNLLRGLEAKGHKQVVLFGEVYGNVQKKYNYGVPNGINFRAFDLLIDGKYMDFEDFLDITKTCDVPVCIPLDKIPYSYQAVVNIAEGFDKDPLGDHPLEGVIVRPEREREDRRIGRVVLKYLTNTYLFDKGNVDTTDR